MPHIFIVGAPRSGTTLLQSILLVHEKIVGFDEETGFFMYRDLFSREFEGIKNDQYEKICLESSDIVSLYDGVAKLRIETIGRDGFFLEKTPQHVLKIDFLLKNFPNAKFLNLFRDIR
ncbi:MAG: sulfotransferase, partial [Gammaproteobacteria bacterium]|nr:sulfotransferase [Gammaproteobacteria bacterium]